MIPSADYIRILPEVILSVFGIIVMLVEATLDDRNDRRSLGAIAFVGVLASIAATGTTNVYEIGAKLGGGTSTLAYVAMALMFVGLGFKVATAPFHVWTPDVYEGAPSPVVALMSTGPKAATFAVMLRIFFAAV